jgi:hypothetical protein
MHAFFIEIKCNKKFINEKGYSIALIGLIGYSIAQ